MRPVVANAVAEARFFMGLARDTLVGEPLPEPIIRDLGSDEIEALQQRDEDDLIVLVSR